MRVETDYILHDDRDSDFWKPPMLPGRISMQTYRNVGLNIYRMSSER